MPHTNPTYLDPRWDISLNAALDAMESGVWIVPVVGNNVADDAAAIQTALTACKTAGGGHVYVPFRGVGTCRVASTLRIYQGTRLTIGQGVTLRHAHNGTMICNGDAAQAFGGYTGYGNIVVEGGIWNMDGMVVTDPATCFSIGHAKNITIRNLTIRDVSGYHHCEINSSSGVYIRNVRFEGYVDWVGTRRFSEALQLDLAKGSGYFGAFGPYDNTPCTEVEVTGCFFGPSGTAGTVGLGRGIGSHSATKPNVHSRIRIVDNDFYGIDEYAVATYNWQDVVISNNTIESCGGGIRPNVLSAADTADTLDVNGAQTSTSQVSSGLVISNNTIRNTGAYNEPILIQGGATGLYRDITVTGNTIFGTNAPQNGIRMSYVDDFTVSGNTVRGPSESAISISQATNGAISGNSAMDTGANDSGIKLVDGLDVSIVGNRVKTCQNGIYVSSSVDVLIQGNAVKNATLYGIRVGTATVDKVTVTNNDVDCPAATYGLYLTTTLTNGYRSQNNLHGGAMSDFSNAITSESKFIGTATITPVANTPTSLAVTFGRTLRGNAFYGQVSVATTVVGTTVSMCAITSVTATGCTLWVTRSNTTNTILHYSVEGT